MEQEDRLNTGIAGLDAIMHGGLIPQRNYLIHGGPGLGKTSLGLHFLLEDQPQDNLLITLSESGPNLSANARKIGLDLGEISVIDVSPPALQDGEIGGYSLLESWDAEGSGIIEQIFKHLNDRRYKRVFIDSLSQLRHLTKDTFQFRKQILSLFQYLTSQGATVMFTAEEGTHSADEDLEFLCDGIIKLKSHTGGRALSMTKYRGSGFIDGYHFYRINHNGMEVFPRLEPSEHGRKFDNTVMASGLTELDNLTRGGISSGTVTIISGPTGVGKTSVGMQFAKEAASRGERAAVYSFEENLDTFRHRCESINIRISEMMESDTLAIEAVEPLWHNPDEFANRVRHEVENRGTKVVMLDSLSGYRQSIRGDNLVERVHALCRYLVNMGVTVLLINEVESITGMDFRVTDHGISYLADTIIVLRYIEVDGELRKTIGVLKKRTGDFEKTLRWFDITAEGLNVGEPIRGFRGVLHGVPEAVGAQT